MRHDDKEVPVTREDVIRGLWRVAATAFTLSILPAYGMAQGAAAVTTIAVHAGQRTGRYTPDWNYFGADEPNYIYAPNGKKLLRELHDLSPVPVYFRPHNLLTTGDGEGSLKWGSTNVYTEKADGTPVYDWVITDKIFDALKDAGVRPLVEVGFMPEAMSTHPEPYRHTFPAGDVFTGWSYPPKDYAKWGALVEAYAAHLKQRYGAATDEWLWEVWNEPDIGYWHGTSEEYDRLYDVTTASIRKVFPKAKVGGPSATGIASKHSEQMLRQFLEHCASGKNAVTGGVGAPLDFISYHPKGNPKFVDGHVEMSLATQLRAAEQGMKIIASYPRWKQTPILLTETDPEGCAACRLAKYGDHKGPVYGGSVTDAVARVYRFGQWHGVNLEAPLMWSFKFAGEPWFPPSVNLASNGYRNGPLYGSSVAEAMARLYQLSQKYGVNLQGGITWAFEFEGQPSFAGFRDLATNGVDKAVLNVFRMYGKLGGDWVKTESSGAIALDAMVKDGVGARTDVDAIATRSDHEVDVLVWNYSDVDLPAEAAAIQMRIDGLPGGPTAKSMRMEEFRMDDTHSNAYAIWQKMGSPEHPTERQKNELLKVSGLQSLNGVKKVVAKDGAVSVPISLPRQGVGLIRISW